VTDAHLFLSPFHSFSTIDWAAFHRECSAHLPTYARPAFIRITQEMALTSTFKHQKGDFAKEGFDLSKVVFVVRTFLSYCTYSQFLCVRL
jgi:hypothetical protein